MIDEKMIKIFFEGVGGNALLFISNLPAETYVNILCHIAVTTGTLLLMYKQYKNKNK